jgi:protease-4
MLLRTKKSKWWAVAILAVIAVLATINVLSGPSVPDGAYLVLRLRGDYAEGPPKALVARLVEDGKVLVGLLDNIDKAAHDDRIKGIIVRVGALEIGWARAREIRDALGTARDAGKNVVAYLESDVVGGNLEYYLASVADKVYVPPASSAMLNGLSAHYTFLGGLWEKADIEMDVQQIREYKTFGDMISRRTMSPAHREMANSILDDVNREFLSTIAASRKLSPEEMQTIIDSCPASADDFVNAGLADATMFYDEITDQLGDGKPVPTVSEDTYDGVRRKSLGLGGGPRIAIIHAVGTIMPGKSGRRSILGRSVGSDTLADAFQDAVDDDSIKAIVFRIDSPGGSAAASDDVWRQVRLAGEKKPLIVSMGDLAASGGYYMACAADRIFAEPATLTGSIGVVMFKPNVAGLLEHLGIGSETLGRGRYARIMDLTKGLDSAERELLKSQMNGVYQLFVERVGVGRSMTGEEVDRIGGGRVWTGNQAVTAGLVDEIGGLRDAIRHAADAAGIADAETVEPVYLPAPKSLLQELIGLRSGDVQALLPRVVSRSLGELGSYADLDPGVYTMVGASLQVE